MKKKSHLGGAWDGSRLVLCEGSGSPVVIPCADPFDIAVLAEQVRKRGWANRELVAALPASLVLYKTLRLPSTDAAELQDMAVLEICRLMPFSPEDIVVQVTIQEVGADGYAVSRVAIARREDACRHVDLYRRMGLKVTRLVPAPQASAALMARNGWLLEATAGDVTLSQVQDNALRAVRTLPVGAASLRSEAAVALRLQNDLADMAKGENVPGFVALAGPPDTLASLRSVARALFPGVVPDVLECESPAASGAALLSPNDDPGLLSSEDRTVLERSRAFRRNVVAAALLAGCLLMAGFGLFESYAQKRRTVRLLDEQSRNTSAEVGELRRLERLLDARQGRIAGRGSLVEVLSRLNAAVPSSVTLMGVTYESGRGVQLQGLAPTVSQAIATVEALSAEKLFDRVEMISSNSRKIQGVERVEFQIEAHWAKEGGNP